MHHPIGVNVSRIDESGKMLHRSSHMLSIPRMLPDVYGLRRTPPAGGTPHIIPAKAATAKGGMSEAVMVYVDTAIAAGLERGFNYDGMVNIVLNKLAVIDIRGDLWRRVIRVVVEDC